VPAHVPPVTFGLLLNLASLPGCGARETIWGFVQRHAPGVTPESDPELDTMIALAVNYARDFVAPTLHRRDPDDQERAALADLDARLAALSEHAAAEDIQNEVYETGKAHYGKEALRDWFKAIYETLLGSSQGPRMGSFIALYGIANSRKLIADALGR
jgi:lysyl-tRNA synthetase class 1